MLARRVCALAARRHHASRVGRQSALRLHSTGSGTGNGTGGSGVSTTSPLTGAAKPDATVGGSANPAAQALASAETQQLAAAQAIALNLDAVSDRELLRRLLMRPQRMWIWVGGAVFLGVTLMAFGPELKLGVSKHTADVASRSLQDETLQSHTRELASQIVQTVLNDPNVLDQASQFLQRLVVMDSTRDALRTLVVHTLNDPVTLAHVSALAKTTVATLLEDEATQRQVVDLLRATVSDPSTRQSLLLLLEQLLQDEPTRRSVTALLAHTFAQDAVKESVSTTLGESVHDVLSRVDIQNHAKQFVGTVVKDQTVQAQSGDAIWSTFMYAVTPAWLSWIWQSATDSTRGDSDAATTDLAATATVTTGAVSAELSGSDGDDTVVTAHAAPTRLSTDSAAVAASPVAQDIDSIDDTEDAKALLRRRRTMAATPPPRHHFPRRRTSTPSTPHTTAAATATGTASDTSARERSSGDADTSNSSNSGDRVARMHPRSSEFTDEFEARNWSGSGSGFL